MVPIDSEYKV